MRVLVLAGLITAVSAPFAAAAENEIECQVTELRRAPAEQRLDQAPQSPAAATIARPTAAPRETAEAPRPATERRRGGKPVPDAQLIQPRGTL